MTLVRVIDGALVDDQFAGGFLLWRRPHEHEEAPDRPLVYLLRNSRHFVIGHLDEIEHKEVLLD